MLLGTKISKQRSRDINDNRDERESNKAKKKRRRKKRKQRPEQRVSLAAIKPDGGHHNLIPNPYKAQIYKKCNVGNLVTSLHQTESFGMLDSELKSDHFVAYLDRQFQRIYARVAIIYI